MNVEGDGYPLAQFRKTYFEECAELLETLQTNLESLSVRIGDHEVLHAIFRSVHSIKGGAGAFGFSSLVAFSHVYESLLDAMREDKISATPEIMQLLVRASDALGDIVSAAQADQSLPDDFAIDILNAMQEILQAGSEPVAAVSTADLCAAQTVGGWRYRIHFTPHSEMLRRANEPLLLIRQLRKLGSLTVEANASDLPSLDLLDPEAAYLRWVFVLETEAPQRSIQDVFEFVDDDCDLKIEVETKSDAVVTTVAASETQNSVAAVPHSETAQAPMTPQPSVSATPMPAQSIRVDVDRVDRLVNLIGELVITQAMLTEQGAMLPADQYPALIQGIEALAQSARELQESVMAIRAQPVKLVFARMPRVVRDLAAVLGKDVRIITSGEMTEIDKTVIEQLNDPLTHMIRNALDHGIESPDDRVSAGKPRQGTIHLSAAQRSGRIVIELADDGRGINRERVLARARERGLVAPGASLNDEEIDSLIFLPAFSTADTVSNISGRGVGMDVVKRNVQALGGRISVQSRFGFGSRFTLSLPLTLRWKTEWSSLSAEKRSLSR